MDGPEPPGRPEVQAAGADGPAAPAPAQLTRSGSWPGLLPAARPSRHSVLLERFTPSWWATVTGTAAASVAVAAFPFPFRGQTGVAWALWWLAALLFALCGALTAARCAMLPHGLRELLLHPGQSVFLAAAPMALGTLTTGLVELGAPTFGQGAPVAAAALFYCNLPLVAACAVLVPLSMFAVRDHQLEAMTAAWLLPVLPACVVSNTAGVLAQHMADPRHALAVAYIGVCLLGVGLPLSFVICTIYLQRLLLHSLPAKELTASSFIPIGPMAMSAWAVLNLSKAGSAQLAALAALQPGLAPGLDQAWLRGSLGPLSAVVSGTLGTFLWALATWWLLVAIFVAGARRGGAPFHADWWSAVFPTGVYAGATIQLAHVVHSPALLGISAACACAHVLLWLAVSSVTVSWALSGVLHLRVLHRREELAAGGRGGDMALPPRPRRPAPPRSATGEAASSGGGGGDREGMTA